MQQGMFQHSLSWTKSTFMLWREKIFCFLDNKISQHHPKESHLHSVENWWEYNERANKSRESAERKHTSALVQNIGNQAKIFDDADIAEHRDSDKIEAENFDFHKQWDEVTDRECKRRSSISIVTSSGMKIRIEKAAESERTYFMRCAKAMDPSFSMPVLASFSILKTFMDLYGAPWKLHKWPQKTTNSLRTDQKKRRATYTCTH